MDMHKKSKEALNLPELSPAIEPQPVNKESIDRMVELYAMGYILDQIGAHFGYKRHNIHYWIKCGKEGRYPLLSKMLTRKNLPPLDLEKMTCAQVRENRHLIVELSDKGYTNREIAEKTGQTKSFINKTIFATQNEGRIFHIKNRKERYIYTGGMEVRLDPLENKRQPKGPKPDPEPPAPKFEPKKQTRPTIQEVLRPDEIKIKNPGGKAPDGHKWEPDPRFKQKTYVLKKVS